LNPKRPDDDSVKEASPPPKFLGICTTISGHDLFVNLNFSSLALVLQKAQWQAAATGAEPATRLKGAAPVLAGGGDRQFLHNFF
jgi:hypothetical protein